MFWVSGFRFLVHYLISTPVDVLHSPFVFRLYNTCIRHQPDTQFNNSDVYQPSADALQVYGKRSKQILHHLMKELNLKNGLVINADSVQQDAVFNAPLLLDVVLMQVEDDKLAFSVFERILQRLHNNSVLIFHHPYTSPAKIRLWRNIKKHPQVTVTVDVFFLGLVFFRKEQVRQDFRLRVF